jgi:hypothetical protein
LAEKIRDGSLVLSGLLKNHRDGMPEPTEGETRFYAALLFQTHSGRVAKSGIGCRRG